ncbi:MAG: hypothetical protein JXA28_00870 [Bacteroidetes bacterium]|nr:hypothetical protein [Bacteroidota bacterium]
MARTRQQRNPFRIHGVATGEAFADRTTEVARMEAALGDPGSKLIVYGPRRMGKTSALLRAIDRVRKAGGHAFFADLSTASSAADMSNRILAAAGAVLGRSLRDFITDLVSRLKLSITLTADPATGLLLPGLDLQAREWDAVRQREALTDVLDALDALAGKRGICIGVAMDEFQEITELGGEKAEWQLRGAVQRHEHLAYVLAGSQTHLIDRMTDSAGAFFKLADKMAFGPIETAVFARWIERRMKASGVDAADEGRLIVTAGGTRTRDIMQLARVCWDRGRGAGRLTRQLVETALREIVEEENDLFLRQWKVLTSLQQNVLRAVAAGDGGLTTRAMLRRFSLGSSGSATNAAAALVEKQLLFRTDTAGADVPTGYLYDSPFFRAWVWWNTLPDLGPSFADVVREGPLRYSVETAWNDGGRSTR